MVTTPTETDRTTEIRARLAPLPAEHLSLRERDILWLLTRIGELEQQDRNRRDLFARSIGMAFEGEPPEWGDVMRGLIDAIGALQSERDRARSGMTLSELHERLAAEPLDALVIVPASIDANEVYGHFADHYANGSRVTILRGRPRTVDVVGLPYDIALVLTPLPPDVLHEVRMRLVMRRGTLFAPFAPRPTVEEVAKAIGVGGTR